MTRVWTRAGAETLQIFKDNTAETLESYRSEFQFLLATWVTLRRYYTSPSLSFPIYNMGILELFAEIKEVMQTKSLANEECGTRAMDRAPLLLLWPHH